LAAELVDICWSSQIHDCDFVLNHYDSSSSEVTVYRFIAQCLSVKGMGDKLLEQRINELLMESETDDTDIYKMLLLS
jgi:hypothetical protein